MISLKPFALLFPVLFALSSAACAGHTPPQDGATPNVSGLPCDGEPYLAIINSTGRPVDVYAYLGTSPGLYVGSVSAGATRMSLVGTPAEKRGTVFYAVVDGKQFPQGSGRTSAVELARRCERAER